MCGEQLLKFSLFTHTNIDFILCLCAIISRGFFVFFSIESIIYAESARM